MKCSILLFVLAGGCVAAAAGAADGTSGHVTAIRHGNPTTQATAASQGRREHVDARQLQRQHHAQDRHAKDVEHGRAAPCDALTGSRRDACLQRASAVGVKKAPR